MGFGYWVLGIGIGLWALGVGLCDWTLRLRIEMNGKIAQQHDSNTSNYRAIANHQDSYLCGGFCLDGFFFGEDGSSWPVLRSGDGPRADDLFFLLVLLLFVVLMEVFVAEAAVEVMVEEDGLELVVEGAGAERDVGVG